MRLGTTRNQRAPRLLAPQGTLPENAIVNLTYCDQVQLTTATTTGLWAPAAYIFRLTGLFDPNTTGTGHQPFFYDQWCTFYDQYRVISAEWTVTGYQAEGGADTPRYLTAMMNSSDESITALDETVECLENKRALKKLMYDRDANGGRSPVVVLKGKCNSKNFQPSKAQNDISALCSANPNSMVNLSIGYANANGSGAATSTSLILLVRIKYKVLFSERKVIGSS